MDKIVEGKLKAFYDQVCLLRQKYVKDNAITISDLVAKEGQRSEQTFGNPTFYSLANRSINGQETPVQKNFA